MTTHLISGYWVFDPAIDLPVQPEILESVGPVSIERTGTKYGLGDSWAADAWAIRCMGRCYGRNGEWDFEPQPSSRTDEWLAVYRWTLDEAMEALGIIEEADKLVAAKIAEADDNYRDKYEEILIPSAVVGQPPEVKDAWATFFDVWREGDRVVFEVGEGVTWSCPADQEVRIR